MTNILFSLLFNKWILFAILFLLVFMFGGADLIFANPIILVFGALVVLLMRNK